MQIAAWRVVERLRFVHAETGLKEVEQRYTLAIGLGVDQRRSQDATVDAGGLRRLAQGRPLAQSSLPQNRLL